MPADFNWTCVIIYWGGGTAPLVEMSMILKECWESFPEFHIIAYVQKNPENSKWLPKMSQRFPGIFKDRSEMFRDIRDVSKGFREVSKIPQRCSFFMDPQSCFGDLAQNVQRLFRDLSETFQRFSDICRTCQRFVKDVSGIVQILSRVVSWFV